MLHFWYINTKILLKLIHIYNSTQSAEEIRLHKSYKLRLNNGCIQFQYKNCSMGNRSAYGVALVPDYP